MPRELRFFLIYTVIQQPGRKTGHAGAGPFSEIEQSSPESLFFCSGSLSNSVHPTQVDMCATCIYVVCMSKMIQLRHVPDEVHRILKARAAMEGLSLSDYLLHEVEHLAERPTLDDLRRRLAHRESVTLVLVLLDAHRTMSL